MRNTYILTIIQALLVMLLFFSEGYIKYTTIGLFVLFDAVLFLNLLTRRWASQELLTFATVFASGLFMIFYVFGQSNTTKILGIALSLLFLVLSILDIARKSSSGSSVPAYGYKIEYGPYYNDNDAKRAPEPVMHVRAKKNGVRDKIVAKAVAYELEREATQLKHAQNLIEDMETYNTEKELSREAVELMNVQRQINEIKKAQSSSKAKKTVKKASVVKKANATRKSNKEAQLKFLSQQEELIKQGKALAKAQKEISEISRKPKTITRIIKSKPVDESFYFATENGQKFHEPGCIALKGVPKNKLTLYTNKKEAMKKGLQPCGTCIPK